MNIATQKAAYRAADLIPYNRDRHEWQIVEMYGRWRESGDLYTVFGSSLWSLTAFLRFFVENCALVMCIDHDGIWFAAWIHPFRQSIGELSVWVRPDCRQKKKTLLAMETVLGRALKEFRTIIGLSSERLIPLHRKLGYIHAGTIADDIQIFRMTKESFRPRLYREE